MKEKLTIEEADKKSLPENNNSRNGLSGRVFEIITFRNIMGFQIENVQLKKWALTIKNPYQKISNEERGSPVKYLKSLLQEMLWGSNRKR